MQLMNLIKILYNNAVPPVICDDWLTCLTHLHDRIISLSEEVWTHLHDLIISLSEEVWTHILCKMQLMNFKRKKKETFYTYHILLRKTLLWLVNIVFIYFMYLLLLSKYDIVVLYWMCTFRRKLTIFSLNIMFYDGLLYYCHDITEILLKVALNTINQPLYYLIFKWTLVNWHTFCPIQLVKCLAMQYV
jgi:hypothetical protein